MFWKWRQRLEAKNYMAYYINIKPFWETNTLYGALNKEYDHVWQIARLKQYGCVRVASA